MSSRTTSTVVRVDLRQLKLSTMTIMISSSRTETESFTGFCTSLCRHSPISGVSWALEKKMPRNILLPTAQLTLGWKSVRRGQSTRRPHVYHFQANKWPGPSYLTSLSKRIYGVSPRVGVSAKFCLWGPKVDLIRTGHSVPHWLYECNNDSGYVSLCCCCRYMILSQLPSHHTLRAMQGVLCISRP